MPKVKTIHQLPGKDVKPQLNADSALTEPFISTSGIFVLVAKALWYQRLSLDGLIYWLQAFCIEPLSQVSWQIHSLTNDCRPCTSQVKSDAYLCPVFRTSPSCILVPDFCELVARIFESPWAAERSSLVHGILYLKIQSSIRCSLHYL
jgi:hypothetical protein